MGPVAAIGATFAADFAIRRPVEGLSAGVANALDNPPTCTGANFLQWTGAAWLCNPVHRGHAECRRGAIQRRSGVA